MKSKSEIIIQSIQMDLKSTISQYNKIPFLDLTFLHSNMEINSKENKRREEKTQLFICIKDLCKKGEEHVISVKRLSTLTSPSYSQL